MNKQNKWWLPILAMSLALTQLAHAQQPATASDPASKSMARNMAELKFGPIPAMPTCLSGAVESGDPMTGPGFILAKLTTGCTIPWHWHTAGEYVMVVSGEGRIDMEDADSKMLTAAGFVRLPSRHVHQFSCKNKCTLLIYTDAAFDIHYTNKDGNEIPPEEALKAVKEEPAPKM